MPVPKPRPTKKQPPKTDRAIQWLVRHIKKQDRPRNHDAVIDLAKQFGADVADMIELFEERAGIRQYDANDSSGDAEVGALSDVRDILEARRRSSNLR